MTQQLIFKYLINLILKWWPIYFILVCPSSFSIIKKNDRCPYLWLLIFTQNVLNQVNEYSMFFFNIECMTLTWKKSGLRFWKMILLSCQRSFMVRSRPMSRSFITIFSTRISSSSSTSRGLLGSLLGGGMLPSYPSTNTGGSYWVFI